MKFLASRFGVSGGNKLMIVARLFTYSGLEVQIMLTNQKRLKMQQH